MSDAGRKSGKVKRYVELLAFILSICILIAMPEGGVAQNSSADRFIVVFHDTVSDSHRVAGGLARRLNFALDQVYGVVLRGFAARLSQNQRQALTRHPSVRYIAPDRTFSIPRTAEGVTPKVRLPEQVLPSGVDRIDAELNPNTGVDIDVAVLDTGIDLDHPDLRQNIAGGIGFIGNTTGQDDNAIPLIWGHGTHVAGVIAAVDNGFGVVGVAPEARLWAVKVLSWLGFGSDAVIIAGLDWVAESHVNPGREPIEVVNMSLGGEGEDDGDCGRTNNDPLHEAICGLTDLGVTVVVAAGNETQDAANVVPAAYDEVLTVSAMDDVDEIFAPFSNFGPDVDLIAPGVNILSTALQPRILGGYSELSGTSFSSPHVAGAALLFIRSFIDDNGIPPTSAEVRAALIAAGEAAPPAGWPGDTDGIDEPLVDAENL